MTDERVETISYALYCHEAETQRGAVPMTRKEYDGLRRSHSSVVASDDDKARAVLAALDAAGLVIVPREPTEAMVDAGRHALRNGGLLPAYTDESRGGPEPIMRYLLRTAAWPAMLDAALSRPGEGT